MQFLQRREGFQISPYHENPVDFDKYDDEINNAETTDKSNASSGCQSKGRGKCEVSTKKTKIPSKVPSRPLTTGCAADFEIFGKK
ncbi:hypothetical protein NPX13_g7140 [Xylaria arbuscula]|uniref:Uncharacterized protein n=1 Tax=Xylaria arbuscula TaxID=114810 RepID=A0A9W8TLG8_9PEZI|nr:hypothetical protein NPX13_g7140 [Xylaria arbuscula]